MITTLSLLKQRKFAPMFFTMLLTAINDNLVKKGLTLYMAYQATMHQQHSILWTSLISGLFMLPFFMISSLGGEWADRYPKATYIQVVKLSEIAIVAFVCYTLMLTNIHPMYYALSVFLMGCHSALFCTAKYSYLPEYLSEDELLAGNSLLEAFTLMGIVVGISLSYVIQIPHTGIFLLSIGMLTASITGYICSLYIPHNPAADPTLTVTWNIFKGTQAMIDYVHENPHLWASILGISWFWFMGTFFLEQLPNYVHYSLKAGADVAVLFNLTSTLGIGIGSFFCNWLLKGHTDLRITPICLMLVSLFGLHFYAGTHAFGTDTAYMSLWSFLSHFSAWRLLIDLFLLCVCCGVYVVPLYARLQSLSEANRRSRVIAAFNIISALWMVSANLVHMIFVSWLGLTIELSVAILMVINLVIALYLIRLIPFNIIKPIVKKILGVLFGVEVKGLEHLENLPSGAIIICNHVSYLDAPILACFLPGIYSFAIDTYVAQKLYIKVIKHLAPSFEIDPNNPIKMKSLIRAIEAGEKCIIFPEGRLSNTGHFMKIYDGVLLLAEKTHAPVITIYIDGVNFSDTSRMRGIYPVRLLPKIRINILPPAVLPIYENTENKKKKALQKQWFYDKMCESRAFSRPIDNIYEMLRISMKEIGSGRIVLEDPSGEPLSYWQLFLKSEVLSSTLARNITCNTTIAVLLPNVQGQIIVLLALYRLQCAPALLNYTSGAKNMLNACITAACQTILTSRAFIEKADLSETIHLLEEKGLHILYLEDLREKLTLIDKVQGLVKNYINFYRTRVCDLPSDAIAAILFTSGSEGVPKGVVLSHSNIVHNIHQSIARAHLTPQDVIFNVLPIFHSFGFTLGTWAPLLVGAKVFLYPNPRHYHHVVELIYNKQATVMIGTNTFLASYQKVADTMDFQSLRNVYAGGEKLSAETRHIWYKRFGIRILEGYGTTECSPVVSINTYAYNKEGSVGRLLPGIGYHLEPFTGHPTGGILHLTGPNIMQGYMYITEPGVIHKQIEAYSTGDVVEIDDLGFITIIDRAKRFAKIGGEMISLTAIEHELSRLWPDSLHAVITQYDEEKGERIVLYTTHTHAERKEILDYFTAQGITNLSLPSQIFIIEHLPLLGTGKIDYQTLKSSTATT